MLNTLGLLVSTTLTLIPFNQDHKPKMAIEPQNNITKVESNLSRADFNSDLMTFSSWVESDYYIDLTPSELIPLPKTSTSDSQNLVKNSDVDEKLSAPVMQMAAISSESILKNESSNLTDATIASQPVPTPESANPSAHPLDANILKAMINSHRVQLGLSEYQEEQSLCEIADKRLPQLAQEIMGPKAMHQGLREMDLPINVTENLIHMATEEKAFTWWLNSPVHRRSIESSTYTHTCGRCIGNSCVQIFSNLAPKVQIPPQI